MNFHIPKTLVQDYDKFLLTEVCRDIKYTRDISNPNPVWVSDRAEISKINFKSKFANADNLINCKVSKSSKLQKGDMIELDGKLYLATWQVIDTAPNCLSTQIDLTNASITFRRFYEQVVNPTTGDVDFQGGYQDVFPTIRCAVTTDGKYDIRVGFAEAGLLPSNRVQIVLQANPSTMLLKIDDVFEWYNSFYHIVNINYNELTYDGVTGLILCNAEKTVIP